MPMKRWILATLLALCLCLAALPALAAPGDATLFRYTNSDLYRARIDTVMTNGDAFYLCNMAMQMYVWKVGDDAPVLYLDGVAQDYAAALEQEDKTTLELPDALFFSGDQLCALYLRRQKLVHIKPQDGKMAVDRIVALDNADELLTTESHSDGEEYTYPKGDQRGFVCVGGKLFLTVEDYNSNSTACQLFSIDVETGETTAYETPNIECIAPYKDGKLLCLTYDRETIWDEKTQSYGAVTLAVFDPETEEMTTVGEAALGAPYGIAGIAYDEETDVLYMAFPEKIYRMVGFAAPELCAYAPISDYGSRGVPPIATARGVVVLCGFDVVIARNADPQYLAKETLTVYGGYASDEHNRAIAQMEDIPVTFYNDTYFTSAQELGQAMVSGENAIDVFIIDMSYMDFTRLMEKGYCYDLSESEKLKAFADELYPFIREAVEQDGKLMAVPVSSSNASFAYYPNNLKETGLNIPKTFLEFCQFLSDWGEKEYYDTYGDFSPIEWTENIRGQLIGMGLSLYANYLMATGQDFTLDTDLFRQVMAAAAQVDASAWETSLNWDDDDEVNEFFDKKQLFSDYGNISLRYSRHSDSQYYSVVAPLSLTEDTEAVIPLNVRVAFINPRSQHIPAAIRYLELYTESLAEIDRAEMCPDMNDPVEDPSYERTIASWSADIALTEKALAEAAPEEKTELEDRLARMRENLAEYEKENRYSTTPESIAAYREMAKRFYLVRPNVLRNDSDGALSGLFLRYIDGQLTLEQLIREGESKLRLMRLE